MDETAVLMAIRTLQEQGKAPSLSNLRRELGGGSWRDIVRLKRLLLDGETPAEGAMPHDGRVEARNPDPVDPPPVPDADVLPAPVSQLEALQEAVWAADAALVKLQRQRDLQQQAAQQAALALYQARREAHRLTATVRQAARTAQYSPRMLQSEAWGRVRQLEAQLAAIVGQSDAVRIVQDWSYTPAWLRAR